MLRIEYEILKRLGRLWAFYPLCSGEWAEDWRLWHDGPYAEKGKEE